MHSPVIPKALKPQKTKLTTLRPWRRAWRRTTGFSLVALIAVPLLVNLLAFAMSEGGMPWLWLLILVAVVAIIYIIFIWRERRNLPSQISPSHVEYKFLDPGELQTITDIVTVAPALSDKYEWEEKPIGTFAKETCRTTYLPNLRSIHTIIVAEDDWEVSTAKLSDFSTTHQIDMPPINFRPSLRPSRFTVKAEVIDELATRLKAYWQNAPGVLVVDVTADTKSMTLTLFAAAQKARVPVTYLIQPDPSQPAAFFQLSVISLPDTTPV